MKTSVNRKTYKFDVNNPGNKDRHFELYSGDKDDIAPLETDVILGDLKWNKSNEVKAMQVTYSSIGRKFIGASYSIATKTIEILYQDLADPSEASDFGKAKNFKFKPAIACLGEDINIELLVDESSKGDTKKLQGPPKKDGNVINGGPA
jgi:hypothetical protein